MPPREFCATAWPNKSTVQLDDVASGRQHQSFASVERLPGLQILDQIARQLYENLPGGVFQQVAASLSLHR